MPQKNTFACLAMLLAFGGSSAVAQEPEESAREAAEAEFRSADERVAPQQGAGGIAFERILTSPENVPLNLAYARERIAAGDLKEGAAAIERILLIRPELHDVRVLYGLVLYRMGMYDRARFELEKALESSELAETVRAEAEVYLTRIKREQRATRGSLTITAGMEYDQNRNQAPSSGQLLFLNIPIDAEGRNGDAAYIVSAAGRIVHDLGSQNGHTLHGEAAYFRSDKVEVDNLDLDAGNVAIGGTWNFGRFSITPRARAALIYLDGEDYLRTLGGELEILMRVRPDLRTYLVFRGDDEDFRATPDFLSSPLRSGARLSLRPGVQWFYSPTTSLRVEGLAMDKNAVADFETLRRYGAFAQHSWLLGRGAFSLISGWAERSDYEGPDAFVSPTITREEWLYRGRVAFGAPISFFLKGAPKGVSDINIIAQYEYETVDSNLLNFDYDTHKVSLVFTKRFSF
ncbi:MAG: tetratricopeptide repeat protein [Pseudomonadota bacterium]